MKHLAFAIAAALVLVSTPAGANPPAGVPSKIWDQLAAVEKDVHGVKIADGEQLVLRVGDGGALTAASRGVAPANLPPPSVDSKVETLFEAQTTPLTAAPDTLVASFKSFGDRGVALKVENGFDHPMIYDAWIVARRGENLVATPTTICPVRARGAGLEQWGPNVLAIIMSNAHEPPGDDMRCSGNSGLVASVPADANVCRGGDPNGPIEVDLQVDPTSGVPLNADAAWNFRTADKDSSPNVSFYFPLQKEVVAGFPASAVVGAMVNTDKGRPKAKSAFIVLVADGVEAARRPWRMYASYMASLDHPIAGATQGARPVGFFGTIPFSLRGPDGTPDPRLEALFRAVGTGKVRQLGVRVEGDDGSLIEQATFDLSSAEIRDTGKVLAALHQAEALSQAPDHCKPPPRPQPAAG